MTHQNASVAKYITVEGPIGVGKSSLAKRLSKTFESALVLEKPVENPFLARFYKSPKRYALPTQLTFLFQRVQQMTQMNQDDMFNPGRVADFMMEKDPIFAQLTLDDDEYRLYQHVYQNLNMNVLQPDLMVYLQAPVEVLLERIRKRRIKYEMNMDASYLQRLSDAYTTYFHSYNRTPLLIVNAADINFIDNDEHYHVLVDQIQRIEAGKHYFNPFTDVN